jgi:hypothetical protein
MDYEQKLVGVFGSLHFFKNLTSFITLWVIRNWQKPDINNFLIFKNLTKTRVFGFHLVFKSKILKNCRKLKASKQYLSW